MRNPEEGSTRVCSLQFDGHMLMRGFWLYVWRITSGVEIVIYVGRTGDSSSNFASSPFVRIGRHLDLRKTAKSNSLARHLLEKRLDPAKCEYEFIAIGPLFPEQEKKNTENHRQFRDRTGALEFFVATELRARGYYVLGQHSSRTSPDARDLALLDSFLDDHFPIR